MLALAPPSLLKFPEDLRCTVIGSGNMGSAFARALVSGELLDKSALTVIDSGSGSAMRLASELNCSFGVGHYGSVADSRLIIITCPQQNFRDLIEKIGPTIRQDALIVSTVPGLTPSDWRTLEGKAHRVTIIPNPAFELGKSLSVVQFDNKENLSAEDSQILDLLFQQGGTVFETSAVTPFQLPGASAVSGCGPAFVAHQVLEIASKFRMDVALVDQQVAQYSDMLSGTYELPSAVVLSIPSAALHDWGSTVTEGARTLGFSKQQADALLVGALEGYLALRDHGHDSQKIISLVATKGGTTEASLNLATVLEDFELNPSWRWVVVGAASRMGAPDPDIHTYDSPH